MVIAARITLIIVLIVILVLTVRAAKPFLKLPDLPFLKRKDKEGDND